MWEGEKDVLPHGEFSDKTQVLKRARHAHAADAEGSAGMEFPFAQTNGARVRSQEAGDEVEERGLAGAVAAGQAGDGAGAQFKARPIQDGPAGKMKGQLFDCEHRALPIPGCISLHKHKTVRKPRCRFQPAGNHRMMCAALTASRCACSAS